MIKERRTKLVIITALIFSFVLLLPCILFAQGKKLEVEYPEFFGLKPETIKTGLPQYAKYIFNFSLAIIGLVLFGTLIRGGFLYLTSAGNPAKLKEARDQISSAFLGTILLLSGYLILTTINPELVIFKFPLIKKPKICEKNEDCPRGFECKEEKCIIRISCNINEDCPYTYECKDGKCVKKAEVTTQIFWEIPIGQMLEKGLWEKERTNKLNTSLDDFERFLKKEIETGGPTFNKISDLNRYLKTLTESCHCEELDGICQKPKNFSFPVGCSGDPCKKVRDKMNNVLKIIKEKSEELSTYKEEIVKIKNIFQDEGRKFRNLENIWERCVQKGLLTRAEYYDSVAFLEEQGGKTELQRLYDVPPKDDPLVFYCAMGGTIFDEPYVPEQISFEKLELAEEFTVEPVKKEPLSCPVVIPLGEVIMDEITAISYETNSGLEDLIYYIDKILAQLTKMTELISQCNKSRCEISCSCLPNPCFGCCTPVPCTVCVPFCKSPCLQTLGGCHGEPCPWQEMTKPVELIKIYEDEIFKLLNEIKGGIEDAQLLLETGENKIDLNMIRAGIQTCLSFGARTSIGEKPEEEPFWVLLRCEMAIGNKGPGDNIITDCHPQNFFCCSTKPTADEIRQFSSVLREERPPIYTPLPGEKPYSPSSGDSAAPKQVPFFSQADPNWGNLRWGPPGCPDTFRKSGCAIAATAMALRYFGVEIDPPQLAKWARDKGYLGCPGFYSPFWKEGIPKLGKEKNVEGIKTVVKGDIKEVLESLEEGDKLAIVRGRGTPPYSKNGHFIVLTGIKEMWGEKWVYYNNPGYYAAIEKRYGHRPIDFFITRGLMRGVLVHK
jgi:hypothetical protein